MTTLSNAKQGEVDRIRVVLVGDIVGKPGRRCLKNSLPSLLEGKGEVLVIANGENAAGGAGLTAGVFRELRDSGVDVVTGGNHIWDRREILDFIDEEERLLRPANLPPETTPGRGMIVIKCGVYSVAVINLVGRVFMNPADCPFRTAERELSACKGLAATVIVDFHGEATSEKQALGWYLDGRAGAVLGTHSHVQTADERILPGGTAYISDVGMTGLYDAILGVDCRGPLQRFLTQRPHQLKLTTGRTMFNAVIVELNPLTGKALSIERIFRVLEEETAPG